MALGQYQLKVDPSEMYAAATNFSQDMTNMQTVIGNIGAVISDIANNWTGGAFSLFQGKFNDFVKKLEMEASKPMSDAAHDILQATSAFEAAESAVSGAVGGLGDVNVYSG